MDRDLFGTTSVVTSHGDLQDLGDDDHTQYLRVDGTRAGATAGTQSFTNAIAVDSTTNSTSSTTGSIQTDGGLGVASDTFIGGTANCNRFEVADGSSSNELLFSVVGDITSSVINTKVMELNNTMTGTGNGANLITLELLSTLKGSHAFASAITGLYAESSLETTGNPFGGATSTGAVIIAKTAAFCTTDPVASITGITLTCNHGASSTTCTDAIGLRIDNPLKGTGTITNAYGIQITKQTTATNNYGIWLSGDNVGADIVFGTSKDDKIYHDSTNLVADCANAFHTTKGRIRNTTRVTTTYQILTTDDVVFCETGSAYTVTLPTGAEGQTLKIINSGTGSFTLTVVPATGEDLIGITNNSFFLYDGETLELTYNTTEGWY